MKTTEELLALSDAELLAHPRVVAAYWAMKGVVPNKASFIEPCDYCGRDVEYHIEFNCHELKDGYHGECPVCGWKWQESNKNPIPGCIETVALEIRDACVEKYWYSHLFFLGNFLDAEDAIKRSTAKQWVVAAVLAWEGMK